MGSVARQPVCAVALVGFNCYLHMTRINMLSYQHYVKYNYTTTTLEYTQKNRQTAKIQQLAHVICSRTDARK